MSKFFAYLITILGLIATIICFYHKAWTPAFCFAFITVLAGNAVTQHK